MLLVDRLPASKGWFIEIIATDLSRKALAVAEEGVWNSEKATEIPAHYLRACRLKGVSENQEKNQGRTRVRTTAKAW